MLQKTLHTDWPLAHGAAFLVLTAGTMFVPLLRPWPWIWLVPLVSYFLLVAAIRGLRHSCNWFRLGHMTAWSAAATMTLILFSTMGLLAFDANVRPDVRTIRTALPLEAMGAPLIAGAVFTIVNASLEELVFRGILFHALESQWNVWVTLTGTAVLFGLGHLHGYPPGPMGACLAGLWGFAVGVLRQWSGGLLLPIVAHMGADATICWILVHPRGP